MEGELQGGEEEDYMSEAFLKGLKDVRPGLLNSSQKRKKLCEERHERSKVLPKRKMMKMAESEARDHALSKPLPSSSKGYSLLQKMGYKEGSGLGKSGEGRTSLIPLVLKEDKGGLGRQSFLKEQATQKKLQSKLNEETSVSEFRKNKQSRLNVRKLEADLKKSQLACEQLDSEAGIKTPKSTWFWRSLELDKVDKEESSDDDEEDIDVSDQMEILTEYLRTTHFYCIWCGTAYDSKDDMDQNCPGNTEELHNA